jgi:enterochelin esterase family protein
MKTLTVSILLLGLSVSVTAQTFNDFLYRLTSVPDSQRTAIVDSFMSACPQFPYLEQDTLAHFIYRGEVSQANVPGDANNWNSNAFPMTRVTGTDFWYHSHVFESDARLDYKFVLNGSTWILDPRNPHQVIGGFGPNSELRMPAYVMPPEIAYNPNISHGALRDTSFYSTNLGNSRTIRIYTPPGYDSSSDSYPMMLFHDGLEYVTLASANNVLDYLIWQRRIQPIIAVFVPPVNRTQEYAGSLQGAFTAFIISELLPYIDARYRTITDPVRRATLGASYGGNIALWLAYSHPEVFGNVAPQSSYIQSSISSGFQNGPFLNLRLCLDLGTYDIPDLIPMVRSFVTTLQQRGYIYQYVEYHEGHSWGNWRAHIDNALEMFFPGDSSAATPVESGIPLEFDFKVFPNPFNSTTALVFTLPKTARIVLGLYDVNGRQIRILSEGVLGAGDHHLNLDTTGLASGVYFTRLQTSGQTVCRKLLYLK